MSAETDGDAQPAASSGVLSQPSPEPPAATAFDVFDEDDDLDDFGELTADGSASAGALDGFSTSAAAAAPPPTLTPPVDGAGDDEFDDFGGAPPAESRDGGDEAGQIPRLPARALQPAAAAHPPSPSLTLLRPRSLSRSPSRSTPLACPRAPCRSLARPLARSNCRAASPRVQQPSTTFVRQTTSLRAMPDGATLANRRLPPHSRAPSTTTMTPTALVILVAAEVGVTTTSTRSRRGHLPLRRRRHHQTRCSYRRPRSRVRRP